VESLRDYELDGSVASVEHLGRSPQQCRRMASSGWLLMKQKEKSRVEWGRTFSLAQLHVFNHLQFEFRVQKVIAYKKDFSRFGN
jgi:hypothetical protein